MTEYRRGAPLGRELRAWRLSGVEVREKGSTLGLVGYASMFDSPYTVSDMLGEYAEVVRAGAFAKTLSEQADVRLLVNHEGIPLARTKSGTLRLSEDSTGLHVDADLEPRMGLANDIRHAMERGDLDEMSFAFQAVRQEWSPDYEQRDLIEVKLYDVSVVTYPANPATTVKLRAADLDPAAFDAADLAAFVARAQAHLAPPSVRRCLADYVRVSSALGL